MIFSDGLITLIEVKPAFLRTSLALFGQIILISCLNFFNEGIWQWSGKPCVKRIKLISTSINISFSKEPLKNHSPGGN